MLSVEFQSGKFKGIAYVKNTEMKESSMDVIPPENVVGAGVVADGNSAEVARGVEKLRGDVEGGCEILKFVCKLLVPIVCAGVDPCTGSSVDED